MSRRSANAIVGILLAAAAAGHMQMVWKPIRTEQAGLDVRLDHIEREILRSEQFTAGVEDLQRYLAEFEGALAKLDLMVPGNVDEDDLIRDVTLALSECGLREDRILRGEPSPQAGVTAHSITVDASGTYAELVRFLYVVEALPRFTRVTRIDIEPVRDVDGIVRANLDVTSYSIRPEGV